MRVVDKSVTYSRIARYLFHAAQGHFSSQQAQSIQEFLLILSPMDCLERRILNEAVFQCFIGRQH